MSIERLTKLLVVGWACAAVAFQAWLLRVIGLDEAIAVVFAAALVAAAWDRRAVAVVLAFTYIFPVVVWKLTDGYQAESGVLWMAALLGAIVPDALRSPWHIPARWRPALVCWALVIAVGTILVVLRETDLTPALLLDRTVPNTARGLSPPTVSLIAVHAGLLLVLGILWIDWLFGTREANLRTLVAMPLAVSCAVMTVVAIYQMVHDVTFLDATNYATLGRASGTLLDGNVCGTVAALWLGVVVWPTDRVGRPRTGVLIVAWAALLSAIWASGSRSALGGGLVILAAAVFGLYAPRTGESFRRFAAYAAAMFIALVVVMTALHNLHFRVAGPLSRMPAPTVAGMRVFVSDLWDRQQYGTAAVAMIRQFPWSGVGVGCYAVLLRDFGGPVVPDNAQNWFRHQVAEFGFAGSLPWIFWVVSLAVVVFAVRRRDSASLWAGRGTLIGFVLISLVGVPSQDVSVTITFWTIAFWFISSAVPAGPPAGLSRWTWAAVAVVVVLFGAATAHAAVGGLRVPARAQRFGWPYEHGFYPPDPGAIGNERWTMRRAVAVVNAPTRWLSLTASVNPLALSPTADRARATPIRPVDVKVWRDGELVLQVHLVSTAPATTVIPVPDGEPRVLLETWASRATEARAFGVADDRELGALISWQFVDKP